MTPDRVREAELENERIERELSDVHNKEPVAETNHRVIAGAILECIGLATALTAGIAGAALTIELTAGFIGFGMFTTILLFMGLAFILIMLGSKLLFDTWLPPIADMAGGLI